MMILFFWGLIFCSLGNASSQLELIADYTVPQGSVYNKTTIGGLSGLFYKDNLLWAVSDDRGQNNEPRIYSFKLTGDGLQSFSKPSAFLASPATSGVANFSVNPSTVLFLKKGLQATRKQLQIDAESLVPFGQGWLVSSEGNYQEVPRKIPSLMYFDSQGQLIREINWPSRFIPNITGKQKKGLRSNYAFEGLSMSPDQKYFFAIHEAPLLHDNSTWRAGDAGVVHLLRFKIAPNAEKIEVDKDIPYKFDTYKNNGGKILASGVSELLAIANDKLLILERAVIFNSVELLHHEAKIYEVSLVDPLEKKLVLDLANIKNLLKTTKGLDNFEGMALGPIINNQPTLLLVSDDNFNPLENTIWLLFKLNLEH